MDAHGTTPESKWQLPSFATWGSTLSNQLQWNCTAPINNRSARDQYGAIGDGTHDGGDAAEGVRAPILSESDNYGFKDYRSISRWKFPFQMLLRPRTRAKMSIGMLHVKVVQARGLMARDFAGKSDPFAELELTGRYLSHGQEWSEKLRVREKTKVVKFSLNPVWNQEFSLPVRRSNATLRVQLWDWNLSIPHDPLGHVEVHIGDELLSKKAVDKWYVLHTPSDLRKKASGVDESDVDNIHIDEAVFGEGGEETKDDEWAQESTVLPEETIDERRKKYGEVRLELRFEFDDLAETCSHIWPEEPHKHPTKPFSPNRIFYSWLLLEKLLKPYLQFIDGTGRVVGWYHPWKSLLWLMLLAVLVLHPIALVFAVNGLVLWIVVTRYWSHVAAQWREDALDEGPGSTGDNVTAHGKAAAVEDIETGIAASAMNPMKKFQKTANQLYQRASSFLPPMEEGTDQELMEIYTEVCKVKRLNNVVETVGKKAMSKDGQELQKNVEIWGTLLMNVRRIFHPLEATTFIVTVVVIILHTLLQLWLLVASRMDLYFLIVLVGIFSASFYGWRGRALILAVKAARHNRRTRLAFTKTGATDGNDVAREGGAQGDPPANLSETSHLFGHRDRAAHAGYSGDALTKEAGEQHGVDEEQHEKKKKWNPVAVAAGGAVAVAVAPGAVAIAGVALAARAAVRASKSSGGHHSWSSRPKLETPDTPYSSDGAAGATSGGGTPGSLEQARELPPPPAGQGNVGLTSGSSFGGMTPADASDTAAPTLASGTQAASLPPLEVTDAPLPAPTVTPPSSPFLQSQEASLFSSAGAVDVRVESGSSGASPAVIDALPRAPASPTAQHPLLASDKASAGVAAGAPDAGRDNSSGRSNALHFGGHGSTLLGRVADTASAGHTAPDHSGGVGTQEADDEEPERNQRSKSAAHKFLHGPSHLMHKLSGKHHHHGHHRDHSSGLAHGEDGATSDPESHGRERTSTGSGKSHSGRWHRPHWGSGSSGNKTGGGESDLDTSHGTSTNDEEAHGPETTGAGGKRKHGAKQRISGLFHHR